MSYPDEEKHDDFREVLYAVCMITVTVGTLVILALMTAISIIKQL